MKIFRKTTDYRQIAFSVKNGIKENDNTTNTLTCDRNAKDGLNAPLRRSTTAFELSGRSILDALFPGRNARAVNSSWQATTNVERKFLAVVSKPEQVEPFFLGKRYSISTNCWNLRFRRPAAGETQATVLLNHAFTFCLFRGFPVIARRVDKTWNPYINVLKRNLVPLNELQDPCDERRSVELYWIAIALCQFQHESARNNGRFRVHL